MSRVLAISEPEARSLIGGLERRFAGRHKDVHGIWERHFEAVAYCVPPDVELSRDRRLLVGAYFTHEYSVEAAALFNPSIVWAPGQNGAPSSEKRFVMSLRAVGEGHLSSIEFRSGTIGTDGEIALDDPGSYLVSGRRTPPAWFEKGHFAAKLKDLGAAHELSSPLLDELGARFTPAELEAALTIRESRGPRAIWFETAQIIRVLASSNYVVTFPADSKVAERVIFPAGPNETRGMEDARFVLFTEDGVSKYYATYTAYDGFSILPQLIETEDFVQFRISTLNGSAAQNKGMALFPRKVGGKYVMLSRRDRENLHLSTSDDVHYWDDVTELYRPQYPWELLHIGNCGSPIETDAGWLVLTHGVGAMRSYAIGAMLLDLDDPRIVKGHLAAPLIVPDEDEREGYVPNVVYTCGAIVHGDELIIPYGFSDSGVSIARVPLADLLSAILAGD